jgi:two-component system OmpR family response regulator
MRILLIEDDAVLAATVRDGLRDIHEVECVGRGLDGIGRARRNRYGVLILDLGLPDVDGLTLCRHLRDEAGFQAPLLVLTARGDIDDKVQALRGGADDYMTKPFHMAELLVRLEALGRRGGGLLLGSTLTVGGVVLDPSARTVHSQNQEIVLRRKEFNLLEYLMRHKNQVVTRQMILDQVWPADLDPQTNTIEVHVHSLRQKIGWTVNGCLIKTIPGVGYKLVA